MPATSRVSPGCFVGVIAIINVVLALLAVFVSVFSQLSSPPRSEVVFVLGLFITHAATFISLLVPLEDNGRRGFLSLPVWRRLVIGLNLLPTVLIVAVRSGELFMVYVFTVWLQLVNMRVLCIRWQPVRPRDPRYCGGCQYDLSGLPEGSRCPECGAECGAGRSEELR
jgi:hypothetical protein